MLYSNVCLLFIKWAGLSFSRQFGKGFTFAILYTWCLLSLCLQNHTGSEAFSIFDNRNSLCGIIQGGVSMSSISHCGSEEVNGKSPKHRSSRSLWKSLSTKAQNMMITRFDKARLLWTGVSARGAVISELFYILSHSFTVLLLLQM